MSLLYNSKKWVVFILPFCTLILTGQNSPINTCDINFNFKIEKRDSIPLKNKSGKTIKYWTQSEFEYITPNLTIDKSTAGTSRIKSINQVIINYGDGVYNPFQIDSLNQSVNGLWVSNEYLKTDFADWVFMMRRGVLIKDINPKMENFFYIYSKPTTKSHKKVLDINDFFEDKSNSPMYLIKVLECKGQWAKIKINNPEFIGWMPWYNFCNNFLTTCTHGPDSIIKNEK